MVELENANERKSISLLSKTIPTSSLPTTERMFEILVWCRCCATTMLFLGNNFEMNEIQYRVQRPSKIQTLQQ